MQTHITEEKLVVCFRFHLHQDRIYSLYVEISASGKALQEAGLMSY